MSAITPQTELRLLKCPLEEDNLNQLTFANATAQYNYFDSLPKITEDGFTYQRKDNIIRFPAHIDDIINYNYVMYQNEAYTNKWFYAFITKMEYVNDHLTYITIKTDVFQTWQFDIVYKRCFTEREHVSNDTVGLHTVPENVELGEYIINTNYGATISDLYKWAYVLHVTTLPDGTELDGTLIGGIFGTGGYFVYQASEITALRTQIFEYASAGRMDSILNLYLVPKLFVDNQYNTTTHRMYTIVDTTTLSMNVVKPNKLDDYTPKNKKLLTFPYIYLLVTNNNGSSNTYQYELFNTSTANFELKGLPTVGGSMFLTPIAYFKGYRNEGLVGGKFPVCSFQNDAYLNWLTQNGLNIALGVAKSGFNIALGTVALSNPALVPEAVGSITSGLTGISNTIGQVYEHSFESPSARGNTNGGDILTTIGGNQFMAYGMTIKSEYAKLIDDYFSMYGYKVNSLKIPNITGRTNWNYVKTIGCNFEGNIPQGDLNEIKNMFNTGVTLWHNPSTFLDYTQSNTIVA